MSKPVKRKAGSKGWLIVLIIVGVIAVLPVGVLLADAPGRQEVQELVINHIDFGRLRDGVYTGEYAGTKGHFRDAQVEATIAGGRITDVKIVKGALDKAGKPAELSGGFSIDDLFDNVIQLRTLQVDAISGATLTSKAHLKALENALKQARAD